MKEIRFGAVFYMYLLIFMGFSLLTLYIYWPHSPALPKICTAQCAEHKHTHERTLRYTTNALFIADCCLLNLVWWSSQFYLAFAINLIRHNSFNCVWLSIVWQFGMGKERSREAFGGITALSSELIVRASYRLYI